MEKLSPPEKQTFLSLVIKNQKSLFHQMKVSITTLCNRKLKEKVKEESQAPKLNDYFDSINTSITIILFLEDFVEINTKNF
jgi:hypothetical protein